MSAERAGTGTGPVLAAAGGLLLAWGGSTAWVEQAAVRDVGGVPLREDTAVPGTEFAPLALPLGIVLLVAAGIALLARGRGRRAAAGLFAAVGLSALLAVALGVPSALSEAGALTAAPWLAAAGALAGLAGAAQVVRRPAAPLLDARYTVEGAAPEAAGDGEWALAADDEGEPGS